MHVMYFDLAHIPALKFLSLHSPTTISAKFLMFCFKAY